MDFKDIDSAKSALKLNGTLFGGRPLYIDSESGKARGGYRARGDFDSHTKYNEKIHKSIKKRKDEEAARKKIKNFKPQMNPENKEYGDTEIDFGGDNEEQDDYDDDLE